MLCLVAALAFGFQDKTTVDRSAEPALRQLFTAISQEHNAHIFATYYRAGATDYYLPDHTFDLWIGDGGKFRMESTSVAGDYTTVMVSDGNTVMNDPMNDDETITLNSSTKPIYEQVSREPIVFMFSGPDAFDKLVDKDQPVIFTQAPEGEKQIEFHSFSMGKIVVAYKENSSDPIPVRIDMFRSFRRRDNGSTESPTPTVREYFRLISRGPIPANYFSTDAPKGKKIEDDRKKAGS